MAARRLFALGVGFCSLAGAEAAAQIKTFCSEPVTPFCVNRTESFEDNVAKQRCEQDVKAYVAKLDEYINCLAEQQREAKGRAEEIEARFACMARGETNCR